MNNRMSEEMGPMLDIPEIPTPAQIEQARATRFAPEVKSLINRIVAMLTEKGSASIAVTEDPWVVNTVLTKLTERGWRAETGSDQREGRWIKVNKT